MRSRRGSDSVNCAPNNLLRTTTRRPAALPTPSLVSEWLRLTGPGRTRRRGGPHGASPPQSHLIQGLSQETHPSRSAGGPDRLGAAPPQPHENKACAARSAARSPRALDAARRTSQARARSASLHHKRPVRSRIRERTGLPVSGQQARIARVHVGRIRHMRHMRRMRDTSHASYMPVTRAASRHATAGLLSFRHSIRAPGA